MKNGRSYPPVVKKAVEFVQDHLLKSTWKQGEVLPSAARLSRMAGVSRASMARALLKLKEKELIHASKGQRAKAGSVRSASDHPEMQTYHWEKIQKLLEHDIASGAFGFQGSLPTIKELQQRYGVCFRTMRKAMIFLEKRGHIRPRGKGYVLPETRSSKHHNAIGFITSRGHLGQASALNSGSTRIVNLFETECLRAGVRLEIMEIDFYDPAESRSCIQNFTGNDSVLGYILDFWWYPGDNFRRAYFDLLDRVATFRKPVAILDEIGNFSLPLQHASNPNVQTFRIEGRRAGERIARHLVDRHHRSAAYFSVWPNTGWSLDRFEGIREHFTRAGHADTVHLYADEIGDPLLIMLAASGLPSHDISRLIRIIRPHGQAADLQERWEHFAEEPGNLHAIDVHTAKALQRNLSNLQQALRQKWDDEYLAASTIAALDTAGTHIFRSHLDKLFTRALADGQITAWICATDSIALRALSFLPERSMQVPRDISVIGFDNIPVVALENHLTTFDFNAMGFIQQMLSLILRPPKPRGHHRHSAIEVEGMIVERKTTGLAKVS